MIRPQHAAQGNEMQFDVRLQHGLVDLGVRAWANLWRLSRLGFSIRSAELGGISPALHCRTNSPSTPSDRFSPEKPDSPRSTPRLSSKKALFLRVLPGSVQLAAFGIALLLCGGAEANVGIGESRHTPFTTTHFCCCLPAGRSFIDAPQTKLDRRSRHKLHL